jgi:hypothetical protein
MHSGTRRPSCRCWWPTPILVYEGFRRVLPVRTVTVARIVDLLLLVSSEIIDAPVRYRYLANDARNVD